MMRLLPLDAPIAVGQTVHVLDPVHFPSGRALRPGRYDVVGVGDGTSEGARRVVVNARLDCSRLDRRFNPRQDGEGRWVTPLCCEPTDVYVEPGDYTAYASGDGSATIPDLAPHA